MEDFEFYRKEASILESKGFYLFFKFHSYYKNLTIRYSIKAINVGTICTANTTDSLLKIRSTINLLISVNEQFLFL